MVGAPESQPWDVGVDAPQPPVSDPSPASDAAPPIRNQLRSLHREILRRSFLGESAKDIALALGLQHTSVRFITTSPLFRAALAEMQSESDRKALDTATRIRMERELERVAEEGIPIAEAALKNPSLNGLARAKIAFGFLDRVGMGPTRKIEHRGDSYREIIERLDELERHQDAQEPPAASAPIEATEASVTFTVRREAGRSTTVTDVIAERLGGALGGDTP